MGKSFLQERQEDFLPKLAPSGKERIRYVPHKSYDEQQLRLTNAHLFIIRNACKYLYWGCHGICPPRVVAKTLFDAVRRSVDVRLITNSQTASITLMMRGLLGWMYSESSNHFRYLLENGVKVYEWQKPRAFHSKYLVIDDVAASIGSYNIARGSTFHHTESNVIITCGEFPVSVRNQFEVDFLDCREILLPEVHHPPDRSNPYTRLLHPRNRLNDQSLLPDGVLKDLRAGRIKAITLEGKPYARPSIP